MGKPARLTLTILLFLGLGLATSVAVAWGNAALFEIWRSDGENWWPQEAASWPGVQATYGNFNRNLNPNGWSLELNAPGGFEQGPIPSWSWLNDPPPEDASSMIELAAGWPYECLLWRIDIRREESLLLNGFPIGAIEGHLPASVFFSQGRGVSRLPLTPVMLNLVVDVLFWAAMPLILWLAWRSLKWLKWNRRRRKQRCGTCGYALMIDGQTRCSECGTSVHDSPSVWCLPPRRVIAAGLGALLLIEVAFICSFVIAGRDRSLLRAAYEGDVQTIAKLLARGVDPDAIVPGDYVETALMIASAKGHVEAAKMLIEAGADVEAIGEIFGYSPVHLAAAADHAEIIVLLGELGANLELPWAKNSKSTPLHFAAGWGGILTAKTLLQRGVDVNARNGYDETAMHAAARTGNLEMVKLLHEHGADIDARDRKYNTSPLLYAMWQDGIMTAEYLLEQGADIGITTGNGQNFWFEIKQVLMSEKLTAALLASEADVNQLSTNGMTPLLLTVPYGTIETVWFMLEHGADINLQGSGGVSPLMYAASTATVERMDMVRFLLKHKADPTIWDSDGNRAVDYLPPDTTAIELKTLLDEYAAKWIAEHGEAASGGESDIRD